MQKLIKITETHYIIVDDSEIKKEDWYYNYPNKEIVLSVFNTLPPEYGLCHKITHSTQPLNKDFNDWFDVETISLSEVEEALGIKNKALEFANEIFVYENYEKGQWQGRIEGFSKAMELTKDKLFTAKQVITACHLALAFWSPTYASFDEGWEEKLIQLLLPKTEWEATFDENNKLKAI